MKHENMKHENENAANLRTGLKGREFMAMLAGCTAGLMVPNLFHREGKVAAATASLSDRLSKLLPLRKLGSSGVLDALLEARKKGKDGKWW